MKVKILGSIQYKNQALSNGDVVEVNDCVAGDLIDNGLARVAQAGEVSPVREVESIKAIVRPELEQEPRAKPNRRQVDAELEPEPARTRGRGRPRKA